MGELIDTSGDSVDVDLPAMTVNDRMQLMFYLHQRGFKHVKIKNNDSLGVTVTAVKHG